MVYYTRVGPHVVALLSHAKNVAERYGEPITIGKFVTDTIKTVIIPAFL